MRELEEHARSVLIAMEAIHHCRPDNGRWVEYVHAWHCMVLTVCVYVCAHNMYV